MNFKASVNVISEIIKMNIENSDLPKLEKEWRKTVVDIGAHSLNEVANKQSLRSIYGVPLARIEAMQKYAHSYSIDRVVIFPVPLAGKPVAMVRVYGQEAENYLSALRCQPIGDPKKLQDRELFEKYEEKYGITVYNAEI